MDSYLGAPGEASGTPTFPTRVSGEPQLMCRRQARVTAQYPHPAAPAKGLPRNQYNQQAQLPDKQASLLLWGQ